MANRRFGSDSSGRKTSEGTSRDLREDDFKPTERQGNERLFSPIYEEPVSARTRTNTSKRRRIAASASASGRTTAGSSQSSRTANASRRTAARQRTSAGSNRTGSRQAQQSTTRGTAGARQTGTRSNGTRTNASVGRRTGAVIQKETKPRRRLFNLPERAESNFTLIAVTIVLMAIGLVMVTSSSYSYAYSTFDNSLYFFWRQLIWIGVGLVAMVFMIYFPLRLMRQASLAIYLFSIMCCVLVLFIGRSANGSTRWLGVGALSFQPAELAKLAVALFVSNYVDQNHDQMGTLPCFLRALILVGIPTALVGYENLSSGLIIGVMGIVIMFVGGAKWEHFFKIILPMVGILVLVLVIPLLIPEDSVPGFMKSFLYRSNRIKAWLNPWDYALDEGYQTVQALYAVGSGGFFGRGLGQSIQKLGYIPEAYNDIIFAIICEELGVFGAGLIVVLFGIYTWNGVKVSIMAPNTYTSLVSSAIVAQIGVQAVLNIAVNTNSIPATGISLPFISYGGSSMLFLMVSVGILLNISTYVTHPGERTQNL